MRILGWLVIIALALVGGFAWVNWSAFMAPATLSLVVFDVYAPIGGVMLAALVVITVLALAFAASWRTSMLIESRRLARELAAQREVADRAEASRIADLGARLERAMAELKAAHEAVPKSINERLDAFDTSLRGTKEAIEHALLEPAHRA